MAKNPADRLLVLDEVDALTEKFRWIHVARVLAAPAPRITAPLPLRPGPQGRSALRPNGRIRTSLPPLFMVANRRPPAGIPETPDSGAWRQVRPPALSS